MDSAVLRRVSAILGHLDSSEANSPPLITPSSTAGEFVLDKRFSVVLPEKLSAGNWNVYRSALSPINLLSRFPKHPEISTLHDTFVHAVRTFSDCNYLGTRTHPNGKIGEYKWMTYGEAGEARAAVGSGLIRQGVPKDSCIGLYFLNRPEWVLVDHACSAYSYVSVPLYDTLGPDSAKYIINHASLKAIFCLQQTLNSLLSIVPETPSVQLIVVVDGIENHISLLPLISGLHVISYSKLLDLGHAQIQPFRPPKSENIATICYTSGTTGTPKGAVLSHGNLVASAAGASLAIKFSYHDVYVSYLPLAHIYERVNLIMATYYGAAVGFYQGDNLKLLDDMVVLRPTIFCSVPRLYNRIYSSITSAVKTSGTLKEKIFNAAYNAKKRAMLNGKTASPIWDKLVFNKIKQKLGGRIRLMCSGASPLSADVMDFLRIVFGCEVIEGYGMTETSCCISTMIEGDCMAGHVGAPTGACEVKLVDVPEMNYSSEDRPYPRGEICARGPNIFQGYYKDEMQTKEILDEDGWLHTGDIGLWLPGGRLKIIDRKKNIFKLAQGEYIAPEKIENIYAKCRFVSQCFVYGDSLKSSLVAVVSVNHEELKAWAVTQGIEYERLEGLCMDRRTRSAVLAEMDNAGRLAHLRGFEMVKAVRLVVEPFSFENGLLTPTFKLKRAQAKSYFSEEISAMYAELGSCSDTDPPSLIM